MIAAVALSTTSCGWLSGLEIDETKDWTPNKLYTEAREAMNSSDWTLAKNYYTKLEARYPFGAYAQQAQLELAYVYFKDEEAAAAVETLDRFLQAYPNHPNSDYALYLKALATLNEKEGFFSSLTRQDLSDRDAKAARDAFDIYKELAARFPESRYASEAPQGSRRLALRNARLSLGDHGQLLIIFEKEYGNPYLYQRKDNNGESTARVDNDRRELQQFLQGKVGKAIEIEYRVLDRGGRITDNYVDLLSLVEPGAIQMSVETDDT